MQWKKQRLVIRDRDNNTYITEEKYKGKRLLVGDTLHKYLL